MKAHLSKPVIQTFPKLTKARFILILGVVLSIILCGYGLNHWRYHTVNFSPLTETNRIIVSTYRVNLLGNEQNFCEERIINDTVQVKKIISKIQTYTDDWQHEQFTPPYTISIGRLSPIYVIFQKNEMKEVTLTMGYLDGFGYYLQYPIYNLGRRLKVEDFKEIMHLIEIDKEVDASQDFSAFCD